MYTIEEIKIANSTARRSGSSVFDKDRNIRSVVARYVADNINKEGKVLDFGCGPCFIQGKYLNSMGFSVDGYDFGSNKPEGGVDKLEQIYDTVYASNVLNVQSSMKMLMETLNQIYNCLMEGGVFIANYPASPRKMELSAKELAEIIAKIFGTEVKRVGGTPSVPVWIITKAYIH